MLGKTYTSYGQSIDFKSLRYFLEKKYKKYELSMFVHKFYTLQISEKSKKPI